MRLPYRLISIHANGFRAVAEGDAVEYTEAADETGRTKATRVTGPNGDFVKVPPRQV
jgi:hypothetical protein